MKYGHSILFSFLLIAAVFSFFLPVVEGDQYEVRPAPDFTAVDENGVEFSLSDYEGYVTILHFTGLESPLCIECLEEMKGQLVELEAVSQSVDNVSIITVNIRKNPYSISGKTIAEQDYRINVSWHWVEDLSPYPIAGLYQEYWTVKGASANPTIVLIDTELNIVGVYHVYCMGRGEIDGVQDVESLSSDIDKIQRGEWGEFKGKVYLEGVTFVGMFVLGIITALSPCSIALLISMISYVGAMREKNDSINAKDGSKMKKRSWQGFWMGISFTIGMALIFFIFGCLISYIGFFIQVSVIFYLFVGIILVILGINAVNPIKEMIGSMPNVFKSNRKRVKEGHQKSGLLEKGGLIFTKISGKSIYLGAVFLGILFSIGWAPCAISVVLPVLILMLTQKVAILMGGLLLFIFGIGHGVPIIPLCTFTTSLRAKLGNKYVSAGKWMERIFGLTIIIIGIILMLRFWGINLW